MPVGSEPYRQQVPTEEGRLPEHPAYSNTTDTFISKATGMRLRRCSYCGKVFRRQYDLVKHVRVHTGERPYSCHLCPMTFTQKESLMRHLREHSGDRPFQCRFCLKAFTRKYYQRRHEAAHALLATHRPRLNM